jgi:hypothetical protein
LRVKARPLLKDTAGINLSFASKSEAATSSYYGASITSIVLKDKGKGKGKGKDKGKGKGKRKGKGKGKG